jgi:GTPase SAR1 family protein
MIEMEEVERLLNQDESPILEFKREWYWLDDAVKSDRTKLWGEFYKDIISLCNGYIDYVGRDRYLIYGFCERERRVYPLDRSRISHLQNLRELKRKVIERLEELLDAPLLELDVEIVKLDAGDVLVLRIPSPKRIAELKAELTTKTRTLDPGSALVRKGQDSDSIRSATPNEYQMLKAEFDKFREISVSVEQQVKNNPRQRSIATTVQLYIERNASYSIDIDYPKSHRDWIENIIFELFRITEAFGGKKYFLYIHENATQAKTYGYLRKNNFLDSTFPIIVLTERPTAIKDSERRKENISQIFQTPHVFFIDDFGFDYIYRDYIQKYEKYNQPVFVESLSKEHTGETNSAITILRNWYESVAAPLMVIKGHGGIGKTTLVKQFLDDVYDSKRNIGLLFIDSNEIIDHLARIAKADKKIDDLYDFYVAQSQGEHASAIKGLSKELLKLSVDNGNLIIVLDGLDEVIARLGSKFDVASFIDSILTRYSSNLERAKIVITCRDNFWIALEEKEGVSELTLAPFNERLAREFFEKSFQSQKQKVEHAMAMAQKFALHQKATASEEPIYIPYVLDTIVYLIQRKEEIDDNNIGVEVKSKVLSSEVSNDILVSSVCEREIKKLANVGVDEQINFFIAFAVKSRVSFYDIKALFQTATSMQIDDDTIEKLKGHPLLACTENTISFRYDFFYEYFKTLYIVRYFLSAKVEYLNAEVITILGSYVGFDNAFTRTAYPRLKLNDELILFALETIEDLNSKMLEGGYAEQSRIRSAISGVFMLILTLRRAQSPSGLDVDDCTQLLHQIFERDGILEGISFVGVSGSDKAKPIFDFRGKTINNSHFERYEYFWECPLDQKTSFAKSAFVQLEPRSGVKPKFFATTFENGCDTSDINDILSNRGREISENVSSIRLQLMQLFKLFYNRGNFYQQKQEYIRSKVFTGKLLPTLLKQKVIIEYTDPEKATLRQYKIADEFRPIVKLVEQGGASLEFERVVKMFA